MKTVIISGGNIEYDFALGFLEKEAYDYLLVVDKGMEFALKAGLVPDEILGDFDSVDPKVGQYYKKQGIPVSEYNPVKDYTDMELALRTAIERGSTEIVVLGATGTRMDHVLGSISNLTVPLENQVECCLIDSHNRIRMTDHNLTIRKEEQYGKYVSLLAFGGEVANLELKGFYYEVEGFTLRPDTSRGISNEIAGTSAEIRFDSGRLIVIESRD
ncbi:MAG: thiamine diphosphokinase [Muricoprocola sp.]